MITIAMLHYIFVLTASDCAVSDGASHHQTRNEQQLSSQVLCFLKEEWLAFSTAYW